MSHILNDFFFIGPRDALECRNELTYFLYICRKIWVPINMSKTQSPSLKIIIKGIEIDSLTMQARLPIDKVEKNQIGIRKNVPQGVNYIKRSAISDRSA